MLIAINSRKLKESYVCKIDEEDYLKFKDLKKSYHKRTGIVVSRKPKNLYFHRLIMDCPPNMVVDHIDNNNLNNRKYNLRICTDNQNSKNQRKKKNNTSGYKGVIYDGRCGNLKKRWIAQIKVNRKPIKIGRFLTKEDAAMAYDNAASSYFGEFANLNFRQQE